MTVDELAHIQDEIEKLLGPYVLRDAADVPEGSAASATCAT